MLGFGILPIMKNLTLFTSFLLALFLLLPSVSAQAGNLNVAYVFPSRLFAAHPAGQQATELIRQRDEELQDLVQELQTLQSKAETAEGLTSDERARANLLSRTVQQTQARYAEDIRAAAEPAEAAIDRAVTTVAQANGYTLVLDGQLAGVGGSSLIVFADPSAVPDITDQVIAELEGQ